MDYQKHYERLIERARYRSLNEYKERHHIIPKCMGGSNEKENLVYLTASEHFIAHQLLVKIHPENHALAHAAKILMGSKNYNNKQFEWVRKRAVESSKIFHTGRKRSKETCDRISKAMIGKTKGRKSSKETCEKISSSLKGRKLSEQHKINLSNRYISDEWKNNLSKSIKGRKLSNDQIDKIKKGITPESRIKLSELRKNSPKIKCPHCSKEVDSSNYKRWHGNNCKVYKNGI